MYCSRRVTLTRSTIQRDGVWHCQTHHQKGSIDAKRVCFRSNADGTASATVPARDGSDGVGRRPDGDGGRTRGRRAHRIGSRSSSNRNNTTHPESLVFSRRGFSFSSLFPSLTGALCEFGRIYLFMSTWICPPWVCCLQRFLRCNGPTIHGEPLLPKKKTFEETKPHQFSNENSDDTGLFQPFFHFSFVLSKHSDTT